MDDFQGSYTYAYLGRSVSPAEVVRGCPGAQVFQGHPDHHVDLDTQVIKD